jgi:hypothetical protein
VTVLRRVKDGVQNGNFDASRLTGEARRANDAVMDDLNKRKFLCVAPRLVHYVDNDALFGPVVAERFPSANVDIRAAGNCLAVGCSTAAVFHLMRVVEHGLRALGAHLGVRRMISFKKRGSPDKQYTPLSYSQWEKIINGLHKRVEKRLTKLRPGPAKQRWQEFYPPILLDINAIREAWRNHVMHSRQDYLEQDAEAIRVRVEAIMRTLAQRVREV